ncbi:transcriptional repressor DicA [Legionella bozemanae]|uniref:Putative prophage repressor CI-like protein n=2 Tax=Legionella bozemanae TaxID=447 RepID=A0A0W0RQ39_LEGBO|nr:putative prophage repressor CI-like protein [Legionella bozemanae]STP14117.1 transcriptional repressor DicA [Legionella bozemanae]
MGLIGLVNMNIKERIGQRIQEERIAKGLTRKALEELTDDLKQSRISNWERGDRTPGPEEIKQLAKALDISPAYLMCLTDEKRPQKTPGLGLLIPILDHQQACDAKEFIQTMRNEHNLDKIDFIPISAELSTHIGENAFALKMKDESMHPELRVNDILIIDPNSEPHPGSLVVAQLNEDNEVIVRKYKQLVLSKEFNPFELRAENDNWGNIKIDKVTDAKIIGVIACIVRYTGKY